MVELFMPTMNVSLTEDLSAFVADQVEGGRYKNQSEVVSAGLRLLRDRSGKLADLRAAVAIGDADIKAGRVRPLTDELLRDIAERAQQRAKACKRDCT
jgi:antitoxin ParD1/3/4